VIDMQPQENFMRKYYTEQAWSEWAQLRDQWNHEPVETRERYRQAWQQLFTEIEAELDLDPASDAAQAFAKRWLQLVPGASVSNDGVRAGGIEAFKDRHNWPPAEQERLLAGFGLDPNDRTESMLRVDTVSSFIGRAISHKVQTNLRTLYGIDPS
jgi:hypothetical protein